MTNSRDGFAKHTSFVAVGQASVKLAQLILAVVLVRLMEPTEWSETAFLLSIYLVGTTIGTLNLHHGVLFFLPRVAADQRRSLVAQNVRLLLAVGVAIAVVVGALLPAVSSGSLVHQRHLVWLGISIGLELPAACVAMTLIATKNYGRVAIWDLAGTTLLLLGTVGPVAAGYGVGGLVVGLGVVSAIRLAAGWCVVRRTLPGSPRPLRSGLLAEQLRYGLPLGLTIAVAIINRSVDKWLIGVFAPEDFGTYAVAAQEVPLLAVLPYAGGAVVAASLVDSFRRAELDVAHRRWIELTSAMSGVVVPVGMALVLIAPDAVPLVFGERFSAGVLPFQLFTIVTLHRVAEYGMLLRAAGRTRELLQVAGVTLGANALLAAVGAATWGMIGASMGTLIASGLGWVLALHHIAAALDVSVRRAFPWQTWSGCVAVSAMAAVLAAAASAVVDARGLPAVAIELCVFGALVAPAIRAVTHGSQCVPQPHGRPPVAVTTERR